jgi:hypothetical protein
MPTSDRLIPSWVEDWFSRGILIRRLNSNDIQGETDVRKAAEALVVGLAVTGVAEFFVVSEYSPKDSFGQLLGLPAYAIVHGVAAITFVGFLLCFLRILRVKIPAFRATALTLYALSGLLPLLMLFTLEILNEAISLMMKYRDPANRYLAAALQLMLNPQYASLSSIIRTWIEILGIVGFFVYYIFVELRRLLIKSSVRGEPRHRIMVALLLTTISQSLVAYNLLGRVYWLALGRLIGR